MCQRPLWPNSFKGRNAPSESNSTNHGKHHCFPQRIFFYHFPLWLFKVKVLLGITIRCNHYPRNSENCSFSCLNKTQGEVLILMLASDTLRTVYSGIYSTYVRRFHSNVLSRYSENVHSNAYSRIHWGGFILTSSPYTERILLHIQRELFILKSTPDTVRTGLSNVYSRYYESCLFYTKDTVRAVNSNNYSG